ncbi:hypothetical protein CERZMDRAFT_99606 [Cercospora zeae-maydis SCOH1-5]|uniref:Zn(2)-C6 fungal-type domain-containing protein n=1 Tax=Cercospora zeae-maydis SCOH1-5 TaxID=717836 RepID=A0A6A6F9W4_9PEZI|nr:hypothetical protein CERZMDRAFT_99606 [Cercospora zeae-maydis SCOH1-5]
MGKTKVRNNPNAGKRYRNVQKNAGAANGRKKAKQSGRDDEFRTPVSKAKSATDQSLRVALLVSQRNSIALQRWLDLEKVWATAIQWLKEKLGGAELPGVDYVDEDGIERDASGLQVRLYFAFEPGFLSGDDDITQQRIQHDRAISTPTLESKIAAKFVMDSQPIASAPPAMQHQRRAHDVKHSKKFPACHQCKQRRVKCSNTRDETGFPCEACIKYGVPAEECMSHFEDPHRVPGVSGATHKRHEGRGSENIGRPYKKKQTVRATRKDRAKTLSDGDEDEYEVPTTFSAAAGARPRRSVRSQLQEGRYRELSENEQPRGEGSDYAASETSQGMLPTHNGPANKPGEEAVGGVGKHVAQEQLNQSAPTLADREAARLSAIETQLGVVAERPAVQMILHTLHERLDRGERNVLSGMRYLLARAAGQPPMY